MTKEDGGNWRPIALAIFGLVLLVFVVFRPVSRFEFTNLDVVGQVVSNPHVHGLTAENLKHIFSSWSYTSYYPVRSVSHALDFELWGTNPGGYKTSNLLMHLVNTLLVFWLIKRLFRDPLFAERPVRPWWDAGVAAFASAIFAVHPVVVEAVAWVPAREELLTTLGALGCMHCHLTARRSQQSGGTKTWGLWHVLAAFFCTLACLSNAVAAVIPFLITAWDVLTIKGPKFQRIAGGTFVLWVVAIAAIVLKRIGAGNDPTELRFAAFSFEQIIAMVKVYGLNLKTLVWPNPLSIEYYNVDHRVLFDFEFLLGLSSLLLTGLVLWKIRRRKLLLFCLLWFGLALGPVSQAIPHHIHRADRFLYLPLVGLVAALAFTLRPLYERLKSRDHFIAMVAAGLASVFLLGVVSARQLQFWRNSITLWEHALTLTPFSALAHQCLADAFSDEGQFQRAIPHYEAALRIAPEDRATLNNYSIRLSLCHKTELRDYQLAIQLAHKGCEIEQWKDPKLRRTLAIAYMNYATDLKAKGEIALAIANYDKAISADPTYEVAMFNQALLLASCSDQSLRRPKEAMRIAEAAVGMLAEPDAVQLSILAKVYAHANRVDKAVTTMRVAIQKAEAQGDGKWIAQLQNELSVLQSLGRGKRADGPRNP